MTAQLGGVQECSPQITVLEYMTPIVQLAHEASNENKDEWNIQLSSSLRGSRRTDIEGLGHSSHVLNHLFMD